MSDPMELTPLLAALWDLVAWLKAGKIPGVVIGGLAASILGRHRPRRFPQKPLFVLEKSISRFSR
jgi:hypothetical protein